MYRNDLQSFAVNASDSPEEAAIRFFRRHQHQGKDVKKVFDGFCSFMKFMFDAFARLRNQVIQPLESLLGCENATERYVCALTVQSAEGYQNCAFPY